MKLLEKNPIIMIFVGVFGASLSSVFVKLSDAPSAVTAALRLLWTMLFITPFVLSKKETRKELLSVSSRELFLSIISGILLGIHFFLWFESLNHTSVASASTIVCTEVIWVALGFSLLLKGRIVKNAAISILVTLAGSVLVAYSDSLTSGSIYGDFLALLAALAVSGYTLIGRVIRSGLSTTVYTFIVYAACTGSLLLICLISGYKLFDYGFGSVIAALLLAVFCTFLGHSAFSWSLKYFSPAFVSASKLCQPVISAVFALLLFSEIPTILQMFGGVLILIGVFCYSRIEMKRGK